MYLYFYTDRKHYAKIMSFVPAGIMVDDSNSWDLLEVTDQVQGYSGSINMAGQYAKHSDNSSFLLFNTKMIAFFCCIV
jgi:hypothetical protein